MNLKKIVDRLSRESEEIPLRLLPQLAEVERYINQFYEGRCILELIQNARDAAKANSESAEIRFHIIDNTFYALNTGKPFSKAGIASICNVGKSPKKEKDVIGHKGIGFKSVLEVSERPSVVTKSGTVFFDRNWTLTDSKLKSKIDDPDDLPLFYFPHYSPKTMESLPNELGGNWETAIILPFKEDVDEGTIWDFLNEIEPEHLALLGSINSIDYIDADDKRSIRIKEEPLNNLVRVSIDEEESLFKKYSPSQTITIPDHVYEKLDRKEKKLFESDREVDLKVAIRLDDKGNPLLRAREEVYLYYPIEKSRSGFGFLLHSYFSVTPDRKELRKSSLNNYLFDKISKFISGQFLDQIKSEFLPETIVEFISFDDCDGAIEKLHNALKEDLREREFVWSPSLKRFFSPDNIILCDEDVLSLFNKKSYKGRAMIVVGANEARFLRQNFDVEVLDEGFLKHHIVDICLRFRKKPKFFKRLYEYLAEKRLDLSEYTILLTESDVLVTADETDVYYGGSLADVKVPQEIAEHLVLLHPKIRLKGSVKQRIFDVTGLKEYATRDIVYKALELFGDESLTNIAILRFLKNLDISSHDLRNEIKRKILFPAVGSGEWLQPMFRPMYLPGIELLNLYEHAIVVDVEACIGENEGADEWTTFFLEYGAWDKPAIYFKERSRIARAQRRTKWINKLLGKRGVHYIVKYDRCFDFPDYPTMYLTDLIIENFGFYLQYITDTSLFHFSLKNNFDTYERSTNKVGARRIDVHLRMTSFGECLLTEKWIFIDSDQAEPLDVCEVIGIDSNEKFNSQNGRINKVLKPWYLDYRSNTDLIDELGVKHLNKYSINNFIEILNFIHVKFKDNEKYNSGLNKDFLNFYNRVHHFLNRLYDTVPSRRDELVKALRGTFFLLFSFSESGQKGLVWDRPTSAYFVDKKSQYDLLSISLKTRIQPFFLKNDSNKVSRIYRRLGKPISGLLNFEIVKGPVLRCGTIPELFNNFFLYLLIVEADIETHIDEVQIRELSLIEVSILESLQRNVWIGDNKSSQSIIEEEFFFDDRGLFISDKVFQEAYDLARTLETFLAEYFKIEIKNAAMVFKDLLIADPPSLKRTLDYYQFDVDRKVEISSLLNDRIVDNRDVFWFFFFKATDLSYLEQKFKESEVDFWYILSDKLMISSERLEDIDKAVIYDDINLPENYHFIKELFGSKSIDLSDYNKMNPPVTIEFRKVFNERFQTHRLIVKKIFVSWLLSYLSKCSIEQQKQFKGMRELANNIGWDHTRNSIYLDMAKEVRSLFLAAFSNLPIQDSDLKNGANSSNAELSQIYNINLELLKCQLDDYNINSKLLEPLLYESHVSSLIYFKQYDYIIKLIKQRLLDDEKNKESTTTYDNGFEKLDDDSKDIEGSTTVAVETINDNESSDSRTKAGTTGYRPNFHHYHDHLSHLGYEAERLVYEKLCDKYGDANVRWVNENAVKAGFEIGSSYLGYDLEYDYGGKTFYVEVKSRSSDDSSFEISSNEIKAAEELEDLYELIWITDLTNSRNRRYHNLGNIFINYSGKESFFKNQRFTPESTKFRLHLAPNSRRSLDK